MKKIGLILFAGFLVSGRAALLAQTDDPSEVFLKAYMTSQQGEKLEHDNQFKAALAKFRFAGSLLEESAQEPRGLAAGDRRISRAQDRGKHSARAGKGRHAGGISGDLGAS